MTNEFSSIITSNYVSVMNLVTGNVTKIQSNDPVFEKALALIREGRFPEVEKLTVKNMIKSFAETSKGSDFEVSLVGGGVQYSYKGSAPKMLHNTMTERIIRLSQEGFNVEPLVKFMSNLLGNPSKTAIDELYLFLENTELPITSDGHFIAYKIVRHDYKSIHDGMFANDVGTVVEMPRNEVCDNRAQTCSYGLHFCSKTYLNSYGSSDRNSDRLVLLKINPADVVSIPSDYNNAKGRASKYLIWKDITEDEWRTKFSKSDYTTSPVEHVSDPLDDFPLDDLDAQYIEEHSSTEWVEVCCPECGSGEIHKKGTTTLTDGTIKQRYKCNHCSHPFSKVI